MADFTFSPAVRSTRASKRNSRSSAHQAPPKQPPAPQSALFLRLRTTVQRISLNTASLLRALFTRAPPYFLTFRFEIFGRGTNKKKTHAYLPSPQKPRAADAILPFPVCPFTNSNSSACRPIHTHNWLSIPSRPYSLPFHFPAPPPVSNGANARTSARCRNAALADRPGFSRWIARFRRA